MTENTVIYEVNLEVDGEIVDEFDAWLGTHVGEMLELPGFESAQLFREETTQQTSVAKRSVQYQVRSQADLDEYLDHRAAAMRAQATSEFGDRFAASRRVLTPHGSAPPSTDRAQCQNCENALTGQYCSYCGQRAKVRIITLWELARDVVGDVFELDSRLWRTLRPLLFKPGMLTREYLAGRRVYYVPPFRMYLVLSLTFFLITTFGSEIEVDANLDEEDVAELKEGFAELEKEFREELEGETGDGPVEDASAGDDDSEDQDICIQIGDDEWMRENLPVEQLQERCERLRDNPEAFVRALLDNIPTMLFFFLPLIALVMKILYLGSGRYYVEHLLFFVHYHSFFFLILTLDILLWRLSDLLPLTSVIPAIVTAVVVIYVPVYLFRAMLVVYGHGVLAGMVRYVLLFVAYFVCLLLTFLGAVAFTALTL